MFFPHISTVTRKPENHLATEGASGASSGIWLRQRMIPSFSVVLSHQWAPLSLWDVTQVSLSILPRGVVH
jgi:hypothetical protein